jgi:hypothetical protein
MYTIEVNTNIILIYKFTNCIQGKLGKVWMKKSQDCTKGSEMSVKTNPQPL